MKEPFPKSQVTLRDYLFVIFHRKKVFLLPFLIIFFTVSIGSFFLPKYYSSSVLLLMQEEEPINPLTPQTPMIAQLPVSLREQLTTLTEKLLNYPQISAVITELGLAKKGDSLKEREELFFSIRKRIKVRLRSAEVVEILFEDKNPEMARKLVNTLVNSFIKYNLDKKERNALIGVEFADAQADVYRKKLEKSEEALAQFREKYPLQTPGKDTDINVNLLVNYQTQLTNNMLSLEELKQRQIKLKNQLNGSAPIELTAEVLRTHSIIGSLVDNLRRTQLQLDDLMHSDPASEEIPELELEIDDLRRRLSEESEQAVNTQTEFTSPFLYNQLEQQLNEIELDKLGLSKRNEELARLVKELEERINSLPEQERGYAQLLRDNEVNTNVYEMLLMKVEENRINAVEAQQQGLQYEILEEGRLPLVPTKPQKLLISIIALVAGLISGFVAVFLTELGDHSFRGVEDAREFLNIPVVGATMKILTQSEFRILRKKQRALIFKLIFIFFIFGIVAGVSSYIQDKNITERILKEQMSDKFNGE